MKIVVRALQMHDLDRRFVPPGLKVYYWLALGMVGVGKRKKTTDTIMEVEDTPPIELVVVSMPRRDEQMNTTSRLSIGKILVALFASVFTASNTFITMKALQVGMRFSILSFYRNAIAITFLLPFVLYNRNSIPTMTSMVFLRILVLSVLEPVVDQSFFYVGLGKTPAKFSSSLLGMSPVLTFIAAWIFKSIIVWLWEWAM